MFDITKLALKLPNFLTHEECDGLINEFEQRSNDSFLEQSKNYETNKVESSNYEVVSLNPFTSNFNLIKQKTSLVVKHYINYLNQPNFFFTNQLKEGLNYSHQYRIIKYKPEGYIHPHSDHIPNLYGSLSFNLNEDYEGGEFKFFNGKYNISLGKGDALIFPADYFWVHEVTPITRGCRYSLNSFLGRYPETVSHKGINMTEAMYKDYLKNTNPEELLGPYN
jgi:hypothetical protein